MKNFDLGLWIEAARPKTWPAAITPVLVGVADSVRYWQWSPLKALGCLGVALGLQVAVNFFNDADDAERGADGPKRSGPRRAVADGLISKTAMRAAGIFMVAIVAAIALAIVPLDNVVVWVLGACAVLAAATYTGGGVAYGYRGLGELICFIFFGLVAVLGTTIVVAQMISFEGILLGIGVGALSVAILEVNNLRDATTDKAAGKMTLAARFGRPVGEQIYFGALMVAAVVSAVLAARYFWVWGSAVVIILVGGRLYSALTRAKDGAVYNKLLAATAFLQLAWGVCAAVGLWLGAR